MAKVEGQRCGTCKYFAFGMRSVCTWEWKPGAMELSSAYEAGGKGHPMWCDDGKHCHTWELGNER